MFVQVTGATVVSFTYSFVQEQQRSSPQTAFYAAKGRLTPPPTSVYKSTRPPDVYLKTRKCSAKRQYVMWIQFQIKQYHPLPTQEQKNWTSSNGLQWMQWWLVTDVPKGEITSLNVDMNQTVNRLDCFGLFDMQVIYSLIK
jgi:hypothetical protein